MNNKGMFGGVVFFVILLAVIIILAPIVLKVAVSVMTATSNQLAVVDSTNLSANTVTTIKGKVTSSFDWMIMLIFLVNFLVLLISAFLIDVHPAFVVIYIIGCTVLMLTAPYLMVASEKIYSMSQFSAGGNNVIQYLPMTEFLMNNFGIVILAVLVVTGIVMYAKIKFFASSGGGNGGTY